MKPDFPRNFDNLAVSLFGWLPARGWLMILGGIATVLVGLGMFVKSHHYFAIEGIPGFYGAFGFLAFALVVLSGWPLRYLLSRKEKYYDEENDD